MARFQKEKKSRSGIHRLILPLCLFGLVLVVLFAGISSVSSDNDRRQRESLENALYRSITYCYAVEGSYPESLDYIRENYGITYDEDRFFVDYRPLGSNIYPDVTIIDLKEG